jgi:hypothetical protein
MKEVKGCLRVCNPVHILHEKGSISGIGIHRIKFEPHFYLIWAIWDNQLAHEADG